jgi:hypothetical protein
MDCAEGSDEEYCGECEYTHIMNEKKTCSATTTLGINTTPWTTAPSTTTGAPTTTITPPQEDCVYTILPTDIENGRVSL